MKSAKRMVAVVVGCLLFAAGCKPAELDVKSPAEGAKRVIPSPPETKLPPASEKKTGAAGDSGAALTTTTKTDQPAIREPADDEPAMVDTDAGVSGEVPPELLAGGQRWWSRDAVNAGGKVIVAGSDYWIWPAGDAVYESQGKVVIALRWRKRPGGNPASGGAVNGILLADLPGPGESPQASIQNFNAQTNEGELELAFSPWKDVSSGAAVVFLSTPGTLAPLSNLLRVQIADD